jgi:hypothetical protein
MKKIVLCCFIVIFAACTPTSNSLNTEGYTELKADASLKDYKGEKVYFKAEICEFEMQHMLAGMKDYVCIDWVDDKGETVRQMLAYTDLKVEKDGVFVAFGTLGSVSGAGKGGGMHTEYYLDLDKVE